MPIKPSVLTVKVAINNTYGLSAMNEKVTKILTDLQGHPDIDVKSWGVTK